MKFFKSLFKKKRLGLSNDPREMGGNGNAGFVRDMSDANGDKTGVESTGGRITPENIQTLRPGQVFVFGSNSRGSHSGGAAAFALRFGAIDGQAEGMQGDSYAIVSMDGLEVMQEQVGRFIRYAKEHPERTFLVTAVGCGIAGFEPKEVAPMFSEAVDMKNVWLPKSFWDYLPSL